MLSNIAASTGVAVLRSLVQFSLTLALTPFIHARDYGLIAFVSPILLLFTMLPEFGLGPTLVRERNLSSRQLGAAFTATCVMGATALALVWAVIPVAGHFSPDARLPAVMGALAFVPLLSLLALSPRVAMERDLRYVAIAGAELSAIVMATPIALLLAVAGAGVWSLIFYNLASQLVRAGLFFWLARRQLRPNVSLRELLPLLKQGKWIMAQNLQIFANRNTDNLLIGARLGSAALGVYAFSYQFLFMPLQAFCWPIGAMLVSYLRHIGDDRGRASALVLAVLHVTAWVTAPPLLALTFVTTWPVKAFMQPSWHEVPSILLWFGPAAAAQCLGSYLGAVLISRGHVRANFLVGLVNTLCLVGLFAIGTSVGLMATVKVYSAYTAALAALYLVVTLRIAQVKVAVGLCRLLPPVGASVAAAGIGCAWGAGEPAQAQWLAAVLTVGLVVIGGAALDRRAILASIAVLRSGTDDRYSTQAPADAGASPPPAEAIGAKSGAG